MCISYLLSFFRKALIFVATLTVVSLFVNDVEAADIRPNPPILESDVSFDCALAKDRCVGQGSEYATIQAAVDDSAPGDTVWIKGGVYTHALEDSDRTLIRVDVSGSVRGRADYS